MDHQVPVRVLHRLADIEEQREPSVYRELVPVAVAVDRLAFDVLEREPRQAVGGDPSVQQLGDMGMVEGGEYLTLVQEPPDEPRVGDAPAQELEGDATTVLIVVPLGEVHDPHAAASRLTHDPVRPDPAAGGEVRHRLILEQRLEVGRRGSGQGFAQSWVQDEQAFDRGAQLGVSLTGDVEVVAPGGRADLERPVQQRLDGLPACAGDRVQHPVIRSGEVGSRTEVEARPWDPQM